MNSEIVKTSTIKSNPNNPRLIKDDKFRKLVKSIQDFPEMLEIRPIVVNDANIVLGGNMRLKACIEAGLKEIPIIRAKNLTPEQQNEFIIKDNVSVGEWDFDILANEWNIDNLEEWGVMVNSFNADDIDLDKFFEENNEEKETKNKIILEYIDEEFEMVNEAFKNHSGSKEQIVFKLLGL